MRIQDRRFAIAFVTRPISLQHSTLNLLNQHESVEALGAGGGGGVFDDHGFAVAGDGVGEGCHWLEVRSSVYSMR